MNSLFQAGDKVIATMDASPMNIKNSADCRELILLIGGVYTVSKIGPCKNNLS